MDKQITQFNPQKIEVDGKFVRICVVCKQPKDKSKFFKDEIGRFDGGDGISKDCRACRLKEARIKKDIWRIERGIKPTPKND